jgi:hypothetical protein
VTSRLLLILLFVVWVLLATTVGLIVWASGINPWLGISISLNAWLGGLVFSVIFYLFAKDKLL